VAVISAERPELDQVKPDRPQRGKRVGRRLTPYLLLAPALAVMLAFCYPIVFLVSFSFQRYGLDEFFGAPVKFAGLDNYRAVFDHPEFASATIRTVLLAVLIVVLTLVCGTVVALVMQRIDRYTRTILVTGLMVAWAVPAVSSTTIFRWMFDGRTGVLTYLLHKVGIDLYENHSVTLSASKTLAVIVLIVTWQAVPFVALTLYAALNQVPPEFYEAATVDGADGLKLFRHVTMPIIRPVFTLLIVLSLVWDLRLFTQVYIFNRGGPDGGSNTLGTYSYFASLVQHQFGEGAAIAVVLVFLAMILTSYYVRRLVKSGEAS
jgi:N,N'-diacetylchitobiose transport system permease protein